MGQMRRLVGGLLLCLMCSVMVSVFMAFSSLSPACICQHLSSQEEPVHKDNNEKRGHKLAVIVPFRDRFDELLQFAPHIQKFLNQQGINHKIYVISQVDNLRFNRASLINIGHLLSRQECDYLVMHDVDLLPLNPKLSYAYPADGPFHVAAPHLHPKYHYSTFVGGILLLTKDQFELVNGLSNKYWGWGLEDDEFYARMKEARLNVSRPKDITTGVKNTFRHLHDRSHRRRDTARLFNQKEATRKRDRVTGLSSVQYELVSKHQVVIDSVPVTVYNVMLICNRTITPWCDPHPVSPRATKG